jgi:hypothetical protein
MRSTSLTFPSRRLRYAPVTLVVLALASCSPAPWQSSSSASTCGVSTEVFWTPVLDDAGPPETSCFPVDVPESADGSTPCTIFVATGSEACRADHGTLPLTGDDRLVLDQADVGPPNGSFCRLALVATDAEGACSAPGFCFGRPLPSRRCALTFQLHPAVRPQTLWHVLLRCAWPAACP